LTRAEGYNKSLYRGTEAGELSHNEIKAIAKSVAKYTSKNFSPEGFSEWQSVQGRKGGLKKGQAKREELMDKALSLVAGGMSQRATARELGVSQQTISNWIKRSKR